MDIQKETEVFNAFVAAFPTERSAVMYVRDRLADAGLLRCCHCKGSQVEHLAERTVRCIECGKTSWFTAQTFFGRAKKLRPLLGLLWFWEHDLPLSSSRASKLFGISQSSAWVMIKKITLGLLSASPPAAGKVVILGCQPFFAAIRKRSRLTPAREHPSAEISADCTDDASSSKLTLPGQQKRILDVLVDAGTSINIDGLMDLTGFPLSELLLHLTYLEFEKLVQAEPGSRYRVNQTQMALLNVHASDDESVSTASIQESVASFIEFCQKTFHGTSRKYLQLYLSHFGRAASGAGNSMDALVTALTKCGPIDYRAILNYISPKAVSLWVQPAKS